MRMYRMGGVAFDLDRIIYINKASYGLGIEVMLEGHSNVLDTRSFANKDILEREFSKLLDEIERTDG